MSPGWESRIKEPVQILRHLLGDHVINWAAEAGDLLDHGAAFRNRRPLLGFLLLLLGGEGRLQ